MVVTVSRGELLPFLMDRATLESSGLAHNPDGLCLLVGETAIRNLRSALVSQGIEPESVAQFETVQSVARELSGQWGSPRVIPESVKRRILVSIVEDARTGDAPRSLCELVDSVGDQWDDGLYETLMGELETYWRMTDAGSDHGMLADVVETVDDPYASHRTERSLSAFAALDTMFTERTEETDGDLYLSESHLVRDARTTVAHRWDEAYGDLDWVAMASVKAIDNSVLRFLRELAGTSDVPDIHCFFNAGTCDRMASRFEQVGIELGDPPDTAQPDTLDRTATLVTAAADGQVPERSIDDVSFVETPDRHREVEQVARQISKHCEDPESDQTPSDFVVVVREASPYRSTLRDVFTSHGIPFHIESQQPVAQVIAYRMVKATVDLVAAEADGTPVEYHDIVAPIRLGFCAVDGSSGPWPLDDAAFLDIEERLHAIQAGQSGVQSVADWRAHVSQLADERGGAWRQVEQFLAWVGELADSTPHEGETVSELLRELTEEYIANTAGDPIRHSPGPGVDTTRTDVGKSHQTHLAREAVLGGLAKVRRYYDYLLELSLATPSWSLAAQALGEALGQDQYGVSNRDGNAVSVVIPANTYFLEEDHTYVLGLGSGEFPRGSPRPIFLHERFYEAAWELTERRDDADSALLHAPSSEEAFQRELDDYEATLRTAQGELTLSRHRKDADGDEVAWSPFVDAVATGRDETESDYRRIRQSQWLPGPGWYGDWPATTTRAPMRDRLRLALHHLKEGVRGETFVPRLTTEAVDGEGTLIRLLLSVDGDAYTAIEPGYRRFSSPLTTITVDRSEAAFEPPHSLESIVGEPARAHEVDLFDHCELKYYFYQYFFSRDGATAQRDDWSATETPDAANLYPKLPTLLTSHYAPSTYRESMAAVVGDHLPNRQPDLAAFDDIGELRTAFDQWREEDGTLDESVFQTLVSEYFAVEQERAADIERDWQWIEGADRDVTVGEYEVRLPPHRIDTVGGEAGARLPVFASARPGASRVATKNCWQSPTDTGLRGETCETVCGSCGRRERCSVTTKGVLDSRIRSQTVSNDVQGAIVVDRFGSAPSGRQGFYRDDGRFSPVDQERHLEALNGPRWLKRSKDWETDLESTLDRMLPGDGNTLSYEVDREFVENGGCEGCEFRSLCMIPSHFDEEASQS